MTPLLLVGDAVSACSGLGRITRDLAIHLHDNCSDIFRVGALGYGGFGSRHIPIQQYAIEEMRDWYIPTLREVWEDFAGEERGILMTVWDASRLLWFSRPDFPQACPDKTMAEWLKHPPFEKWGYFPVDAAGPNGKLSCMLREVLLGYDRVLTYTKWAEGLMAETLLGKESQKRDLSFLPHGIDTRVFRRRDHWESRRVFHKHMGFQGPEIGNEELLIGIVATNQARKDYGLAVRVVAELAKTRPVRLFIQTDILERYWSIPALLMDYGLLPQAIVNTSLISDDLTAQIYSGCDVTLGIGSGEGFGYPIFESLACGTPCVTGRYGGHVEFMEPSMLVTDSGQRMEGLYNNFRPIYRVADWVKAVQQVGRKAAHLTQGLAWPDLWPKWEAWFRSGHSRHLQVGIQAATNSTTETDKDELDPDRQTETDPEVLPVPLEFPVS